MSRWLIPLSLLIASNIFMMFAWSYHLKAKSWTAWSGG